MTTLELLKEIKSLHSQAARASEDMFVFAAASVELAEAAEERFKKIMSKKVAKHRELIEKLLREDDEAYTKYLTKGGFNV